MGRCDGDDAGSGIEIKTSLTPSPPGEDSISSAKEDDEAAEEEEEETETETETRDREEEEQEDGGDRSGKAVEEAEENACLVTIMKRMIAEEVRKYVDGLGAQHNGPGPGPGPGPEL